MDHELTQAQREAAADVESDEAALHLARERARHGFDRVYAVSRGEYSDYRIVAMFTRKDKADELRERLASESACVEEWPLDVINLRPGWHFYEFTMDRDGNVDWGGREENPDSDDERSAIEDAGSSGQETEIKLSRTMDYNDGIRRLICRVYARSRQHAVKVANEHRAQIIASGEWDGSN